MHASKLACLPVVIINRFLENFDHMLFVNLTSSCCC